MNHPSPLSRLRAGLAAVWRAVSDIDRTPFYFLLAAILTFSVECLSRHSVSAAAVFAVTRPLAFLANYGMILLTVLLSLAIPRRAAAATLTSAIWAVLGVAQCIILFFRVSPLTAEDIAIALSVLSIISAYLPVVAIVLIIAGLIGLLAFIVWLFFRVRSHAFRWKQFVIVYGASLGVTVLVFVAGFATGQLSDDFPELAQAYDDYGFPYCFGLSITDKGVDRPEDYGEELMTDILDDLPTTDEADTVADRKPNVIMVQLESFFDVNYLEGVSFSENPVPHFSFLKRKFPSGLFNVSVIGAGTVNTEFEVLTGMSVADFGAGEYPFRSIMLETTCETIAYDLLDSGYRTHAIHNNEGSFYLRHDVYKNMGFETYTSIEYFENPTYNQTGWAHDELLTDEILHIMNTTEESDFIFAVSVQGHGKYPDEYLPADDDILITSGMENEVLHSRYLYYINQINEVDDFIGELYDAVMAMEEDTVLVLYGDHLPSIIRDEGVSVSTKEYQTEYVIIPNYDTPVQATGGELYTYELFPTVMEVIGNSTGVMNRFYRAYRDDPEYSKLLSALEYDVLYGRRMAYGGKAYPVMDTVMGTRPIVISGYEIEGEYLYVYGQNFTTFSVVTTDGHEEETEFLDGGTLRVRVKNPAALLERTDRITVRQISVASVMLSETEDYWVRGKEED